MNGMDSVGVKKQILDDMFDLKKSGLSGTA